MGAGCFGWYGKGCILQHQPRSAPCILPRNVQTFPWTSSCSSLSSRQLPGFRRAPTRGKSPAEPQKVHVGDGHPLITSGSRSSGFAGGWSQPRAVSGYVSVSPKQQQLAGFVSCCLFALLRVSDLLRADSEIQVSRGEFDLSISEFCPRRTASIVPISHIYRIKFLLGEKEKLPQEELGKCFHFKVQVSYGYLQMFIEVE